MGHIALDTEFSLKLLRKAADINGFDASEAKLVRNGSHVMWTLRDDVVARVGELGTTAVAEREVAISAWLNGSGVRVVRTLPSATQPTVVDGYPVTWWELLPKHRQATPTELGSVLRKFHRVPVPRHRPIPRFAPLSDLRQRLTRAAVSTQIDVAWLLSRVGDLERRYAEETTSAESGLIHGDAWQGNVAVLDNGVRVVLDLEAVSVGPQSWDLVAIAVDCTDFGRISRPDYEKFVSAYGLDVLTLEWYRLLADIQELRWTAFVVVKAEYDHNAAEEAVRRIACLKGEVPKPWRWRAF